VKKLLALVLITHTVTASAGWTDGHGTPIPDTMSMKSAAAFGVQLVLTAGEKAFADAWNQRSLRPVLPIVHVMRRGSSVTAMLLFAGCKSDSKGNCNVSVKYQLTAPDGSVQNVATSRAWLRAAPKPGVIELSDARLDIGVGVDDPRGRYTVTACVTDNNAGTTLSVSTDLDTSD
jgi:hypothetical protein